MLRAKLILLGVLAVLLVLVTALPVTQGSSGPRRVADVTWVSEARQVTQPVRALGASLKPRFLALLAVLVSIVVAAHWAATHAARELLPPQRDPRWAAASRRGPPSLA